MVNDSGYVSITDSFAYSSPCIFYTETLFSCEIIVCSGIWNVANLLGADISERGSFISTRDITHLPFQTLCIVLRLRLKLILKLLRLAVSREGKLVCVTRGRCVSLGRQYVTCTLHPSYTHSCFHTTDSNMSFSFDEQP